ncbi:hypothetical protein TCA2_3829 [Paenibacillus sp. TCA20]|nr:hypothetical protein TCA2_3829 [Paenibacillus sp. TCA20]
MAFEIVAACYSPVINFKIGGESISQLITKLNLKPDMLVIKSILTVFMKLIPCNMNYGVRLLS